MNDETKELINNEDNGGAVIKKERRHFKNESQRKEFWLSIFDQKSKSGLTAEEYCKRNKISASAYYKNKKLYLVDNNENDNNLEVIKIETTINKPSLNIKVGKALISLNNYSINDLKLILEAINDN